MDAGEVRAASLPRHPPEGVTQRAAPLDESEARLMSALTAHAARRVFADPTLAATIDRVLDARLAEFGFPAPFSQPRRLFELGDLRIEVVGYVATVTRDGKLVPGLTPAALLLLALLVRADGRPVSEQTFYAVQAAVAPPKPSWAGRSWRNHRYRLTCAIPELEDLIEPGPDTSYVLRKPPPE